MSRFFDLLQKPEWQTDDLSFPSVSRAPEHAVELSELEKLPIEEVQIRPASRIVCHTAPRSPGSDRFRLLRMRLRELWKVGKLKTLLVTSPLPHDGKSTITLNLATALAEGGKRAVLVIEGDLHHSSLTQQLGIKSRYGLAECLTDGLNPMAAVRCLQPLGWYCLPAGQPHKDPTELLQSQALSGVMQQLSPHFDWILIDSPPVRPLTDSLSLRQHADGSLLVVRADATPRDAVEQTIALLGREHIVGIVLNGIQGLEQLYSKYYGQYGPPPSV